VTRIPRSLYSFRKRRAGLSAGLSYCGCDRGFDSTPRKLTVRVLLVVRERNQVVVPVRTGAGLHSSDVGARLQFSRRSPCVWPLPSLRSVSPQHPTGQLLRRRPPSIHVLRGATRGTRAGGKTLRFWRRGDFGLSRRPVDVTTQDVRGDLIQQEVVLGNSSWEKAGGTGTVALLSPE